MNILLIDRALPSSLYSGKTVRLRNIYGKLSLEANIIYLRTSQPGEEKESADLEEWANLNFKNCLRLSQLPKPYLMNRALTTVRLKPWYDLFSKHPLDVPQLKRTLLQIAKENQINLIITFDQEVAQYGLLLSEEYPWIQDLGDSMLLQIKRRIKETRDVNDYLQLHWRLVREKRFEHEMISKATSSIFVAEDDASLHRNGRSVSMEVIPNGVDTDYFNPDQIKEISSDKYVVFTGHMNFKPNEKTVIHFAKHIFPIVKKEFQNLKFKIVGADPSEKVLALKSISGVEVAGQVPDVRPYLKGALAFVCPMSTGSGIKNKILEALSMKVPIIASSISLKGISNLPESIVEISNNPKSFASKLIDTIKRGTTANVDTGRRFVVEQYSWDKTIGHYRTLFSKLSAVSQ